MIAEKGKELNLTLDCKTRWNSLEAMVSRFLELRKSISKVLIDIKDSPNLSDGEFEILSQLVEALTPIRMLSEAIGGQRTNIIQVDGALKFLFKRLKDNSSPISEELLLALKNRLGQRWNQRIVSLAKYLHNHEVLKEVEEDNFFEMCNRRSLIETAQNLSKRLFQKDTDTPEVELISEPVLASEDNFHSGLKRAMNQGTSSKRDQFKSLSTEFSLYEKTGNRTVNLEYLYKALLTVKPTSMQSERAFSVASLYVTRIRSRLNDNSLDMLCSLKSYFKSKELR